jgi:hypothetical protein
MATLMVTCASSLLAQTDEDVYILSPFEVTAEEDSGYIATTTLAGTRVRTDLRDIASAISVVTGEFLKDTGAKNTQDLLVYTTNTEVGGITGNYSGAGGSPSYNESPVLRRPNTNTRVRGLDAADNTRNFFLTEIPWDGYNVERVDMQRGPNSILFGVGSPAGIINTGLISAEFTDKGKFENRIGSFGSLRNSIDYNHQIIDGELAVRVAALADKTKYRQKPSFNDDKRIYATLRWDPKLFGDSTYTAIKADFESGKIKANRPRSLPPVDAITPWFWTGETNGVANLNKLTLDPYMTWDAYGDNYGGEGGGMYAWFKEAFMGRLMSSNMASFYNANSSTALTTMMPNIGTGRGVDSNGNVSGVINGINFSRPWGITTWNKFASQAIAGGKYYSDISLADDSVFDFYNKLIDGPNKREWQEWEAFNTSIQQTYFNGRLGWEFVFDHQSYEDGQVAFLNGGQYVLSVDINTHLLDGSVNPNVGRPYVGNSGQYGNNENFITRDNLRFTLYGDVNAKDLLGDTFLAQILGRHVFTGLMSKDIRKDDNRSFARWATEPGYAAFVGNSTDITNGARQFDWITYLGDSLQGASSASGAKLNAVTSKIDPSGSNNIRFFDSRWNAEGVDVAAEYLYMFPTANGLEERVGTQSDNPANYVGWTNGAYNVLSYDKGDVRELYTSASKARNSIESKALTWQGYLFGGNVVPVFGWRKDTVENANTLAPKGAYDVASMDYTLDRSSENTRTVTGESKSWGIVLHTPAQWRASLPGNTGMSLFYNKSENFKADAPRGDIFGNQIENPFAETVDYGFALSTMDDKINLRVTWYKTEMKNATLAADSAGFGGGLYYSWALPYWGATHALAALDGISGVRQGDWGWPWNGIATDAEGNPDNARIEAIVRDFFTNFPLDQNFVDQYGLDMNVDAMRAAGSGSFDAMWASVPGYGVNGQGASALGLQPAYAGNLGSFGSGPVASVDTVSEGVEVELTAMLTSNWNLTINASKTDASIQSISPSIQRWIDTYTTFMNGDAGLIKLWGGDTFRTNWENNILAPYSVLQGQIGQQAPEIAPWRFNLITNYRFADGAFRGFNVGMAYRWEDKKIVGYQYNATTDTLDTSKPWYGETDAHFDLWTGYERAISSKIDWRIQLNLRNVGEDVGLVTVSRNPDGAVAFSRIQEGMTWTITNTFSF